MAVTSKQLLLQQLLTPELKLLGQEAKKRHPPLRDACDRALAKMTEVQAEPDEAEFLRKAEELWRPMLIAFDCKSNRLLALSLGALQKLLTHGLVLPASITPIVSTITKIREGVDEPVQLKVLQCIMGLFSSTASYELSSSQLAAILSLAFTMHSQKNHTVQSTAAAALTQVTNTLFDRLGSTKVDGSVSSGAEQLFPTAKNAYLLIKDLCQMAAGETGHFIKVPPDSSKIFILDLLYDIVQGHAAVMALFPQFVSLVREDLSLLLAQQMQSATDLPTTVRIHRIVTSVVQLFPVQLVQQQELFINLMMKAVEHPDTPAWHKVVVLNCWRDMGDNYLYLKKLFLRFDHVPKQPNLFLNLVTAVSGVIQKLFPLHVGGMSMSAERTGLNKLLAVRTDEEVLVRPAEPVVWAIDTVVAICKSLGKLVELEGRPLTDAELENDVEEQRGEKIAAHMLNSVWAQILGSCSLLLEKSQDEEIVEETLRCFKQFTHACGKAGLVNARDSFITAMNKFTLPAQGSALTPKNMQVLRVVFDVANGLGGVLGSSWYLLLKNFQQLTVLLDTSSDQASQSESLVRSLLSMIFEGTRYFENDALISMINALCSLSAEAVTADPGSPSSSPQSKTQHHGSAATFGLQRLADVATTNVLRLQLFWSIYAAHLPFVVAEAQDEAIRKACVDTLSQVVLTYLQRYKQFKSQGNSPKETAGPPPTRPRSNSAARPQPTWLDEPPPEELWQLQPQTIDVIRALRVPERGDVRVGTLNLIHSIIQRAGHELVPTSWKYVLAILSASSQMPNEVSTGFKSAVLICSDFMSVLDHGSLQGLIGCVGHFAQQTAVPDRTNTNLSAIQLTLSIADYCSSHLTKVSTTHWNSLFVQLRDAAGDPRPEVRHSAMKTLFTALVTHGNGIPQPCWNTLFWDVLLRVLDSVHSAALAAEQQQQQQQSSGDQQSKRGLIMHHSRNTTAKQYHETICIALDGVTRIVRVFFVTISNYVTKLPEVLKRLSVHLANACQHSSEEVATVGLKSLQLLLLDVSTTKKDNVKEEAAILWDQAWATWERIGDKCSSDVKGDSRCIPGVLTTMVEGIAELYEKGTSEPGLHCFTADSFKRLLPLLDKVMRSPIETLTHPSKLQIAVLNCIQSQPPFTNPALWEMTIQQLCGYLPQYQYVEAACIDETEKATKDLIQQGHVSLCERVLTVLQLCFCNDKMPQQTRKVLFPTVVKAMTPVLLTRYITASKKFELWRTGIPVLCSMVESSVQCIAAGGDSPESKAMWDAIVSLSRTYFTFNTKGVDKEADFNGSFSVMSTGSQYKEQEEGDVTILNIIRDLLRPSIVGGEAWKATRDLLDVIEYCARQRHRRALADAGMKGLFDLCNVDEEDVVGLAVGRVAMPLVVTRCKEVLCQYLVDDRASGRCPLPRYRHDEVVCILRRLVSSELAPVLFEGMGDPPRLRETCPAAFRRRGLVVRLFPVLVEFVTCRDDSLKGALTSILRTVAQELGFPAIESPFAYFDPQHEDL
eukprot:Sspe_Gene.12461::Locus_4248_Transcript_1_1_Confidence_1.000_Length_4733::g.12461::m.12461